MQLSFGCGSNDDRDVPIRVDATLLRQTQKKRARKPKRTRRRCREITTVKIRGHAWKSCGWAEVVPPIVLFEVNGKKVMKEAGGTRWDDHMNLQQNQYNG